MLGRDSVHGGTAWPSGEWWGMLGQGQCPWEDSMHSGSGGGQWGREAQLYEWDVCRGLVALARPHREPKAGSLQSLVEGGADDTWQGWGLAGSHPLTTARTHWGHPGSPVQTLPEAPSGCLDTSAWAVRTGDTLHLTAAQWGLQQAPALLGPCLSPASAQTCQGHTGVLSETQGR